MALAESIYAKLIADTPVLAPLGQSIGASIRIYPAQAPATPTVPYVVFQVISTDPTAAHNGPGTLDLTSVQFSIVAATYLAARDLRKAIRAALDAVTLAGGEKTVECTERDGFSDSVDQHVLLLEASIWNAPAVPA